MPKPSLYRVGIALLAGALCATSVSEPARAATVIDHLAAARSNESHVAGATLRVTAVGATTGKKLSSFCIRTSLDPDNSKCTTKGAVVLKNIKFRTVDFSVFPARQSLYLSRKGLKATLKPGKTTNFVAKVQLGGAIQATAIDRTTGQGVKGVYFAAAVPGRGGLPDSYNEYTDAKGKMRTYTLPAGKYNLFADPQSTPHGMQWVGATGGTGDQRAAATITVKAGKVTAAPVAKLDKGGNITGTVTGPDGTPIKDGDVSVAAWTASLTDPRDAPAGDIGQPLDLQGRYTYYGLGPYQWPLVFTTDQQGRQWSGGKGNRYAATPVQVVAGETVTHDEVIQEHTKLTGKISVRTGEVNYGDMVAFTPSTGDPVASAYVAADGQYTMLVPGDEQVKIQYYVNAAPSGPRRLVGWYDHATSFEQAKIVTVPHSGTMTFNFSAN